MKYFFLSNGWTFARVWQLGGLWDETVWQRQPHIQRLNLGLVEQGEVLWLYQVEDGVLMVEVKPLDERAARNTIGQVVLKRLMSAEQVIERLKTAEAIVNQPPDILV